MALPGLQKSTFYSFKKIYNLSFNDFISYFPKRNISQSMPIKDNAKEEYKDSSKPKLLSADEFRKMIAAKTVNVGKVDHTKPNNDCKSVKRVFHVYSQDVKFNSNPDAYARVNIGKFIIEGGEKRKKDIFIPKSEPNNISHFVPALGKVFKNYVSNFKTKFGQRQFSTTASNSVRTCLPKPVPSATKKKTCVVRRRKRPCKIPEIKWPKCDKICMPCCCPIQEKTDCSDFIPRLNLCKKIEYRIPAYSECATRLKIRPSCIKECCYNPIMCPYAGKNAVMLGTIISSKKAQERVLGRKSYSTLTTQNKDYQKIRIKLENLNEYFKPPVETTKDLDSVIKICNQEFEKRCISNNEYDSIVKRKPGKNM